MVILKLILHRYKRFFLENITTLEYSPKAPTQIILGTNGSGKTSLLKELTPMPANINKNYLEGGYKEIHIEHSSHLFVLTSGKISKSKHSFLVDGEEKNNGGTRTVQIELVKQYFNLTPSVLSFLLGETNFTSFTPLERKEWLTTISNVDYSYANSLYSETKNNLRDIQGALKILEEGVAKDLVTIKSQKEIEVLEKNKIFVENFISYLASLVKNTPSPISENNYIEEIKQLNNKLNSYLKNSGIDEWLDCADIDQEIKRLESELKYLEENIVRLKKIIKDAERISVVGREGDLIKEIKDIEYSIKNFSKREKIFEGVETPQVLLTEYKNIYPELLDEFSKISSYDKIRNLKSEELENIKREYEKVVIEKNKYQSRIEIIDKEINYLESLRNDANSTACPKCEYIFYPGYDQKKIDSLNLEKEKYLNLLERDISDIKNSYDLIESFRGYKELLKNIIKHRTILNPVWKYFFSIVDLNKSSPGYIITIMDDILKKLEEEIVFSKLNKDLKVKKELLGELQSARSDDKNLKSIIINDISRNLENDILNVRVNNEKIKKIYSIKRSLDAMKPIYYELRDAISKRKKNLIIDAVRNNLLIGLTNIFKKELVEINSQLLNHKIVKSKIDEKKKELKEYRKKEKILSFLERALSPKEGILGKSISHFINLLINDINDIINSIWSYSMRLEAPDLSDELGLDYKFKITINGGETIEDISNISSSMKEVVNLSFRILVYKYLELRDIPLYLDEFGSTFDSLHRARAYSVIDKVIGSGFKQIFLICHYENLYGNLKNSEYNILSYSNIDFEGDKKENKNFIKHK